MPTVEPTKSGTKTTEFWVAVAPVFLGLVEGKDNPEIQKYMILAGSVLGGLYIISRTLVKWKSK
jgi:hypothetical protein